jgi:hypothetical protein
MAKNKPKRSLQGVGDSQKLTEEKVSDKFTQTASIAHKNVIQNESKGRISPQISCTVGLEEKKMLDELTVFATTQKGKSVNLSTVIRALIRLGYAKKNELDFDV